MKNLSLLFFAIYLLASCNPKENKEKNLGSTTSDSKEVLSRNLKPDGTEYNTQELEALPHDELMALVYETPRDTIRTIGILLYDGYFSLDAIGPHSVLSSMYPAKTFFIAEKRGIITSNNGLKTQVDTTMAEVENLDILLIPGGGKATVLASEDQALLTWIKTIDSSSKYTTSVCTGAWILGAAGLLEGKKATTNWYRAEEKISDYGATFVNERYTHDGKYWTSAGVSAGIDMSLALADHIMGRNFAESIMLNLEYDPKPPFDGGSPEKTDPVVTFMMEKMYDLSIGVPANESEE